MATGLKDETGLGKGNNGKTDGAETAKAHATAVDNLMKWLGGGDNAEAEGESERVVSEESETIRKWRDITGRKQRSYHTGITLSGGGIRSATFSIGILQALASKDFLKTFDYMSTVSGGGYAGTSLLWWLGDKHGKPPQRGGAGDAFGLGPDDFPYGTRDPAPGNPDKIQQDAGDDDAPILAHLRRHGRYLVPGGGISYASGVAIVLRAILLNLLVWIPISAVFMACLFGLGQMMNGQSWLPDLLCTTVAESTSGSGAGSVPLNLCAYAPIFLILLLAAGILLAVFVIASLIYALYSIADTRDQDGSRETSTSGKYVWRRLFEKWGGRTLTWSAVLIVCGSLPYVHAWLHGSEIAAIGGAISIVVSSITALMGHVRTANRAGGGGMAILIPLASAVFVYSVGLLGYSAAFSLSGLGPPQGTGVDNWFIGLFWISFIVALLTSIVTNVNYISLHRFYRDRLMEAFLPDWSTVDIGKNTKLEARPATNADSYKLHQAWSAEKSKGPFPIINTNVILVNSENRKWRNWGGDSFVLTPQMCGSDATRWSRTSKFTAGQLTLPSAMAISGAAVHPNAGPGGDGLTRNRVVAIVMTLLNFRLGYWVRRPGASNRLLTNWPNHILPSFFYSMTRRGFQEPSEFLELSDGGHFDNLGLYELLRRKCRFIIVCDGEADSETAYTSFVTVIRRAEDSFKVRFSFKEQFGPERLVPRERQGTYPSGAKFADAGHFVAQVHYPDGQSGVLIYMKTTLIEGLSMKALSYAGANPAFPDQTTADQFFDEEQFEAYRELGYKIASKMYCDLEPHEIVKDLDDGKSANEITSEYWDERGKDTQKQKQRNPEKI